MSRELQLGSWFEITVPMSRMQELSFEIDTAVACVGGATITEGRGYYKRLDGEVDYEEVNVIRFDFHRANLPAYGEGFRSLVKKLHRLGEESVLVRQYYNGELRPFQSELIFK